MAPRERVALMGLAARLARERRVAVLVTEHDMDIVFSHADRIIVLSRGELIAEGKADAIRRDPLVLKTYLGEGRVYGAGGRLPCWSQIGRAHVWTPVTTVHLECRLLLA